MDIDSFIDNLAAQFDDVARDKFTPDANFRAIPGWSSLVALSVIAMADEEYGVTLRGDDVKNAATIQDLFNAVQSKKA